MTESELRTLAERYVGNKKELDHYTRLCKEDGDRVKEAMLDMGLKQVPVSDTKALRKIISVRYDVDEAKMLAVIKKYKIPATKTVEVIDEEALEKFLYNLNEEENTDLLNDLDLCKTVKSVVSLKVVNAKTQED